MKTLLRYLFAVFAFGLMLPGCDWNSDPLELVYPGTDLSGNKDVNEVDEKKKMITDFENLLSSVWDGGWKIIGNTTDGIEMSVYYIFDVEDGTFQTKSTINLSMSEGEYKLSVTDDNKLNFTLSNSDLKQMGDETLIVQETTDGKITFVGATTGSPYEMINATQAEIDDVADPLVKKLRQSGWSVGVVRLNSGVFKAYYYLDDVNFYFVSFDKDTKTVVRASYPLEKDGNERFVWETPFNVGDAAITGIQYNEETKDVTLIGLDADADLKLVKNISVDKDDASLTMMEWLSKNVVEFKEGDVIVSDGLQSEFNTLGLRNLEWNGSWTSIVFNFGGYYFYKYKVSSGMFPVKGADILHLTGEIETSQSYMQNDETIIPTNYPTIYNFLIEQDHIIVRDGEDKASPLLMLSISSEQFIYWPKAAI